MADPNDKTPARPDRDELFGSMSELLRELRKRLPADKRTFRSLRDRTDKALADYDALK